MRNGGTQGMALEIGSIVEGVVTGITHFGAFVKLPEGNTGLVHISEVADSYVEDVRQFLNEKDKVMVRVLGVNNKGKYDLSLKQAASPQPSVPVPPPQETVVVRKPRSPQSEESRPPRQQERSGSFEDRLNRFLKESEERLLDLKRNTEAKRGKGRGRGK